MGDYNLNCLNKTEKSKLVIFSSNSGLEIDNLRDATRITDKILTLIDHCFVSKDQIIAYKLQEPLLNLTIYLLFSNQTSHLNMRVTT